MLAWSKAPIIDIHYAAFICIRRGRLVVSNNNSHVVPIGYHISWLWLAIDNNERPYLKNLWISPIPCQRILTFSVHLREPDSVHVKNVPNKDIALVGKRPDFAM